jgi:hypothetical protein
MTMGTTAMCPFFPVMLVACLSGTNDRGVLLTRAISCGEAHPTAITTSDAHGSVILPKRCFAIDNV